MALYFKCRQCGSKYKINSLNYRCRCGGLFQLEGNFKFRGPNSLTLGEGDTPLLKRKMAGRNIFLKLDYLMPTGSFKDRGAALMLHYLVQNDVQEIVEDSSGNAGSAVAAYAAAAGIKCHIYLPAETSKGKIRQIKAYGADIVTVEGSRDDVSKAVKKEAEVTYYASHIYNPLFLAGTSSLANELADNPGIPDVMFVPAGNGTMLLGLYYGFKKIGKMPRLIAVQSENCCPLYNDFYNRSGLSEFKSTQAEGIAIGQPPRREEILEAVRDSEGLVITVSEEEISDGLSKLYQMGLYVEPTAAVAPAGYLAYVDKINILRDEKVVIPLTGSGLKK